MLRGRDGWDELPRVSHSVAMLQDRDGWDENPRVSHTVNKAVGPGWVGGAPSAVSLHKQCHRARLGGTSTRRCLKQCCRTGTGLASTPGCLAPQAMLQGWDGKQEHPRVSYSINNADV